MKLNKMRFKHIILITLTFLIMGCDGSYQSNKDEMVTELKTYDNNTPSDNYTSSCTSSGCMFIAVGLGTIISSPDETNWINNASGTSNDLQGVTYSNSTFIAVGGSGTIVTSSDGLLFHSKTSGTGQTLKGVSHSNSTFVVVGDAGTTSPLLLGTHGLQGLLGLQEILMESPMAKIPLWQWVF